MAMDYKYTGIFVEIDGCYTAFAAELPGAITQGRTLEEAEANLKDAVEEILNANRRLAERELAEAGISDKKITRKEMTIAT
jgi:predicted RNase H-like HicB family nuclease